MTSLPPKILLVEDDPAHRLLIENVLAAREFVVQSFGTIREAREDLRKSQAVTTIILSDLHLPEVASAAVVDTLRSLAPKLPIVVLTSSRSLHEAIAAMRAGAEDYLVKEFDDDFADLLELTLRRVLTQREAEAERRRLEYEMTVLQGAVENGQDGFAIVDESLQTLYVNPGFRTFLTEWTQCNTVTNLSVFEATHPRFVSELQRAVVTMLPGGVWHTELEQNSPARAVALSISSVTGEDVGSRYVLWVRDITEVKRRHRLQRNVVATTTHDLRGPLGTVVLSAKLLKDRLASSEDGKVHELLMRMASSVDRAKNIVDQFLDRQSLEEGVMVLTPEPTAVLEVTRQVVLESQLKGHDKRVSLVDKDVESDLVWMVDRVGYSRIVENLVANALKFSPPGAQVKVWLEQSPDVLVLRVQDEGSGIPAHLLPSIFERGVRLPEHKTVTGLGLGLWIVKSLVDGHGGKVEVRSSLNQGTEVSVFLPTQPPVDERGSITISNVPLNTQS